MTCGKTTCPDLNYRSWDVEPFVPDAPDTGGTGPMTGFLQVMPPDFDRDELQDIRDRARKLSIQGSPAKTMEERLYQQLADIADQLDAIACRFETEVADMNRVTIRTEPVKCIKHACDCPPNPPSYITLTGGCPTCTPYKSDPGMPFIGCIGPSEMLGD